MRWCHATMTRKVMFPELPHDLALRRARLEGVLARVLPAPVTLLTDEPGSEGGSWLWIQGRRDRLHRILVSPGVSPGAGRVNWTWTLDTASKDASHGVLDVHEGGAGIVRRAVPVPGIFLADFPDALRAWRALSSF